MPDFKVLLLDGIDPAGVDVIKRSNSIEPIVHDKISREKLLDIVPGRRRRSSCAAAPPSIAN